MRNRPRGRTRCIRGNAGRPGVISSSARPARWRRSRAPTRCCKPRTRSPGDSAGRSGRAASRSPGAAIRSPSRSTPTTTRSTAASTPRRGRSTSSPGRTTSTRRSVKKFEKAYNVKVKITTFENEEEALAKLTSGASELRRLVRDRRLPLAHRRRQAHPAGQPLVPPEPEERVAAAAEPVLRRALALLGAVHRLHDRHRVAEGQGEDAADRVQERLRRVLARTEVRRQGRDPRRPARGARHGAPAPRRAQHQHREREARAGRGERPEAADEDRQREDQHDAVHRRPDRRDVARSGVVGRHGRARRTTCRRTCRSA